MGRNETILTVKARLADADVRKTEETQVKALDVVLKAWQGRVFDPAGVDTLIAAVLFFAHEGGMRREDAVKELIEIVEGV